MKTRFVFVLVLTGACQRDVAAHASFEEDVNASSTIKMFADGRDLVVATSAIENRDGVALGGVQCVQVVQGRGIIVHDSKIIKEMPAEQRFANPGDGFYAVNVMNAAVSDGKTASFFGNAYYWVRGSEVTEADEASSPHHVAYTDAEIVELERINATREVGCQ
jgi:hypothetical protein